MNSVATAAVPAGVRSRRNAGGIRWGAAYSFVTEWLVAAPPERTWEPTYHPLEWPSWWKGVEAVVELEPGDDLGVGALHCYTWKRALPYRLEFEMRVAKVERPSGLEGLASGELEGTGVWTFMPEGESTLVRYEWEMETTRPWTNKLAWVLRPAFAWNHNYVMRSGALGLAKLLSAEVEVVEHRARRSWRLPVIGGVVAAVAATLWWRRRR